MIKKIWLPGFCLILLANIVGVVAGNELLQFISKPLLMPLLTGYFISQSGSKITGLKKWILLALFFSWAGDIILMFQDKQELFFLLGLGSFLLAHVFYIVYFHNIRVKENVKSNILLLLPVVVYYAFLISWLSPYLGDKKIPVRIYGIVISFMLLLALHMLFLRNKAAGRLMMLGALLFVISDSVLAINKFYESFEAAGILIMLTYGLAQLLIVQGAIKYIREQST